MNRDHANWQAAPQAAIDWRDDTPLSTDFGDIYYSQEHGLEESRHVFLRQNQLPERLNKHIRSHFCIVETGFGSGLNFLSTWQAWNAVHGNKPKLHFISIEKYPLTSADLSKALSKWPELSDISQTLIAHYPQPLPGLHRLIFADGRVLLDLYFDDVLTVLDELSQQTTPIADAWYLDGFSPEKNTAMWRDDVFNRMAQCSHHHATVGTFTAAGFVRRGLSSAGFSMTKTPGYGRKREQLCGQLHDKPERAVVKTTPWHTVPPATIPERCIVIGAGLAGANTARALAQRGVSVTVLEQDTIASAASGNPQGILYTRLSLKHSPLQDFALHSFSFATRQYQDLFATQQLVSRQDGELCGSFHPQHDIDFLNQLTQRLTALPDVARIVDAEQASRLLGVAQQHGGIFFPQSGWLNPNAVCRALLSHPLIKIRENLGAISLKNSQDQWHLHDRDNHLIDSASHVVLATGISANQTPWLDWLPLRAIRGQVTYLPNTLQPTITKALCAKGYIAPAVDGAHCIGASFDIDDLDLTTRDADHRANLNKLAAAIPQWREALDSLDTSSLQGRAALRCTSPDYLPIAGAVPDYTAFLHDYGTLRKNARTLVAKPSTYVTGLYVNTAHGSRGLTSTPLAAEMIASTICQEPLPLPAYLQQALSPGRFIIRDLSRNRI